MVGGNGIKHDIEAHVPLINLCPAKYDVNSEWFSCTLLHVAHHFTKWVRNHFVRKWECWPNEVRNIDLTQLLCWHIAAQQVLHLDLSSCIPSQFPFLLNLGGHKKAHITKLSQVVGISVTILDILNLRVCNRDQSRIFFWFDSFCVFRNPLSDMLEETWKR